jgi:hypothetical protein
MHEKSKPPRKFLKQYQDMHLKSALKPFRHLFYALVWRHRRAKRPKNRIVKHAQEFISPWIHCKINSLCRKRKCQARAVLTHGGPLFNSGIHPCPPGIHANQQCETLTNLHWTDFPVKRHENSKSRSRVLLCFGPGNPESKYRMYEQTRLNRVSFLYLFFCAAAGPNLFWVGDAWNEILRDFVLT